MFFGATLRQVAPVGVAHVIYQLDVNFRSATLLGVVGAGGIGFYLLNANRVLQFEVVTFILVLIVAELDPVALCRISIADAQFAAMFLPHSTTCTTQNVKAFA